MLLQRWLRSIVALIVTQPFYINNLPYLYNQLNIINFITFCNSSMIFVHIMLFKSITSMCYTWTSNYYTLFEYVPRKMLCARLNLVISSLRFSKSVEVTNQFWKWMFLHRGQAILISFMLSDLIIKSGPSRNEWELQLTKQWNFFLYEGLLCHHCFQQILFMQLVLCTVFYKVLSRACLKSWHHNKQVFDFFSNVKLHWNGYLPLVTHLI